MKSILSYSLLAAAMAAGVAVAQPTTATTTPVGYVTETISPNKYNLIGLTLHQGAFVSGTLASSQPTVGSVVAASADFSGIVSTDNYIVEISSGSSEGVIFEVPGTSFNDSTDTITIGGTGSSSPYASSTFIVRKAATLSTVFGTSNEVGLLAGASAAVADVILVPSPSGSGFDEYFYSNGGFFGVGWRKSGAGAVNQANSPISYIDGVYLFRRGATPLTFTIAGEVKLKKSSLPVTSGFGTYSSVYPVGVNLANSGLQASLTQGASATAADVVLIPTAVGFDEYFYSNGGFFGVGWRKSGAGATDQGNITLPSAYLIQRRGAAINVPVNVPAYGL
jgi:hypothetical protein